jgi:hypothetical protein
MTTYRMKDDPARVAKKLRVKVGLLLMMVDALFEKVEA